MRKFYLLISLLMILAIDLSAQIAVSVNVRKPTPSLLSEWQRDPTIVQIIINNSGREIQNALFDIVIYDENSKRVVTTDINHPEVPKFRIPMGSTILNGPDIISVNSLDIDNRFDDKLRTTNSLPEGDYQFCVTLKDQNGNELSSTGEACAFFIISIPDPPILISPIDDEEINPNSFPQFVWTPVTSRPPEMMVSYRLKIAPIYEGQNLRFAIDNNQPLLNIGNIATAFYQYSPADPSLNSYTGAIGFAWQVEALDQFGKPAARNEGKSEIGSFKLKKDKIVQVDDQFDKIEEITSQLIPMSKISGTLLWSFRKSETNSPANFMNLIDIPIINDVQVEQFLIDPNINLNPEQQIQTGINAYTLQGQGQQNSISVSNTIIDNVQLNSNTFNDLVSSLTFDETMPLGNTQIKIEILPEAEPSELKIQNYNLYSQLSIPRLLGIGKTKSDGTFEILFNNPNQLGGASVTIEGKNYTFTKARIIVENKYFNFQSPFIEITKDENNNFDLGELIGVAKTYRFKPTIKSADNNEIIPDAKVEIFRPSIFYFMKPYLRYEGFISEEDKQNEMMKNILMTKISEGASGTLFTKLFMNIGGAYDNYYVRISAKGYDTLYKSLSLNQLANSYEIPTVEKEYRMTTALPMIEGRVVRKDNMAPIEGATVTLTLKKKITQFVTVDIPLYGIKTNSDGKFVIADIPLMDDPYILKVKTSKAKEYSENFTFEKKGIVITRDPLLMEVELNAVVGRIVNDDGKPVTNATLRWKSGGDPVLTDNDGRFFMVNVEGWDTLNITKIGFKEKDTAINVKGSGSIGTGSFSLNDVMLGIQNSPSMKKSGFNPNSNQIYSFDDIGYSASDMEYSFDNDNIPKIENIVNDLSIFQVNSTINGIYNLFGDQPSYGATNDIGSIKINKSVGRLLVTVKDSSTSEAVVNASIILGDSAFTGQTDNSGQFYFNKAPGGNVPIRIVSPNDKDYVPISTNIFISDAGDTTLFNLKLEMGARLTGNITSGNNPVEGARIRVEGRDDLETLSNDAGTYVLSGVPLGEWTIKVTKTGLVGKSATRNFEAGTTNIDFNLTSTDYDISTLLGFDIEVDTIITNNDTRITGAFVNIKPNDVFSVQSDKKIPFSNVKINIVEGKIVPADESVQTDLSELEIKLFNFLKVKINEPSGIKVLKRNDSNEQGRIVGKVSINYASTFLGAIGWKWDDASTQFVKSLTNDATLSQNQINVFNEDGSTPLPIDSLLIGSIGEQKLDIYGFDLKINLTKSSIKSNGLHLRGNISLSGIPLISSTTLEISDLWIGTDGTIKDSKVKLNPAPKISLAGWELALNSAAFNETGFKFGGKLKFAIPKSQTSEIVFSNLSLSPSQIFGGNFSLPSQGIDVFNIVKFKSKIGKPISFGKVANQNHYFITGGGVVELPKYIDKKLDFESFYIQTNGDFAASINTNFSANFFGIANIDIDNIAFSSIGTPSVDIEGGISLTGIPLFSAKAGGIHYKPGGIVTVDKIGIGFSLASVAKANAEIEFIDTPAEKGFKGAGSLEIYSTPINISTSFYYLKSGNGVAFGASFVAGVNIPVGTVTIEKVGGGFTYNSGNNQYSVKINGEVSVAPGTGGLLKLAPLEVTVASGPVIHGYAGLQILNQNIANAELWIDYPNKLFSVETKFQINFLEDLNVSANAASKLVISAKTNDPYWMVGAYYNVSLLGLINSNAKIVAGWNLKIGAHPEHAEYTNFVPADFRSGDDRLFGVHVDARSFFGQKESDAKWHGVSNIGEVKAWYYNDTWARLHYNYQMIKFGLALGNEWGGGGKVKIFGLGIAGADVGAGGELSGSFSPSQGWNIGGSVSAHVVGWIGSCTNSCQTKICWGCCFNACVLGCKVCPCPKGGKICVNAGIGVNYSSKNGMSISLNW